MKAHPATKLIRHNTNQRNCASLRLPCTSSVHYIISTAAFNGICSQTKIRSARPVASATFAEALRELRNTDLTPVWGISQGVIDTCYQWLTQYETDLQRFGHQAKTDAKNQSKALTAVNPNQPTAPVHSDAYLKIAAAVTIEFARVAGPLGDATKTVQSAKDLADAFERLVEQGE